MRRFRADLHIHTVLSACADLEMSPVNIVQIARERNIELIAITDHNTTLHCALVKELAEEMGLALLCGTEVTTREEVHCLTYFPDLESLGLFQQYLEEHLPVIPYQPEQMGYQALVDRDEQIIRLLEGFLNVALDQSIDQVEQEVHRLGGLFIPAHIERPLYGIINQLGFIPTDLKCDALGIMGQSNAAEIRKKYRVADQMALIRASDAHSLDEIGRGVTTFELNELSFEELKKALSGKDGRRVITE